MVSINSIYEHYYLYVENCQIFGNKLLKLFFKEKISYKLQNTYNFHFYKILKIQNVVFTVITKLFTSLFT